MTTSSTDTNKIVTTPSKISTATTAAPTPSLSRTQQRVLLQREKADADSARAKGSAVDGVASSTANMDRFTASLYGRDLHRFSLHMTKETDRLQREYASVRRMEDPVGDSLRRIRKAQTVDLTPTTMN